MDVCSRGSLNRFDAAEYIGISTRLLDSLASDGEIPRVKLSKRKTVFRVVDLDAYLESKIQRLGVEDEA